MKFMKIFPSSVILATSLGWVVLAISSCASAGVARMPEQIVIATQSSEESGDDDQALEGSWDGFLTYRGQDMGIKLYFLHEETGWFGRMDIPPQNAFGLVLGEISFSDGALKATLPGQTPLVMEAALAGVTLSGGFSQGPATGSIRATRSGDAESLRSARKAREAAATAKLDPAIVSQEVSIGIPGGKLYGTLSRPLDGSAMSAVLIIPGSGPTDRDGNSTLLPGKNDSLLLLGNELVKSGLLVLCVDKRAIGKSTWSGLREEDLTIDLMADDASAWLSYLRGQPGIRQVAVIGHSEGALVALLSADRAKPDALVLLAPISANLFDTLFKQLAGAPEDYLRRVRFIYEELRAGRYVGEVDADLLSLFRPSVQPYMRSLIEHQPAELLASQNIPTLVVAGGRDLQIALSDTTTLASARPDVRFMLVEDMNHVLKAVGPELADNQAAYSQSSYPLAEGLVSGIVGFLSGK